MYSYTVYIFLFFLGLTDVTILNLVKDTLVISRHEVLIIYSLRFFYSRLHSASQTWGGLLMSVEIIWEISSINIWLFPVHKCPVNIRRQHRKEYCSVFLRRLTRFYKSTCVSYVCVWVCVWVSVSPYVSVCVPLPKGSNPSSSLYDNFDFNLFLTDRIEHRSFDGTY